MTSRKYPSDLTDDERDLLEPLLPAPKKRGRPKLHTTCEILDAAFHIIKTGCQWRMPPRAFPPWKTVFHYFRRLRIDGIWERMNRVLRQRVRKKPGREPDPLFAIRPSVMGGRRFSRTVPEGFLRGWLVRAGGNRCGSSGRTLHRGRRGVGPDDVELVEVPPFPHRAREARSQAPLAGKILLGIVSVVPWAYGVLEWLATGGKRSLYRKRIRLDGDVYLEFVDRPSAKRGAPTGFGLAAEHETTPTFSWEWFNVGDGQGRARKLQEDGELGIRLEAGRSGDWEVGYTEFLTDVSLRMEPREGAGWRGSGPRWRVQIVEGSRVAWPSAHEAPGQAPPS